MDIRTSYKYWEVTRRPMRYFLLIAFIALAINGAAGAGDLYQVTVASEAEAEILRSLATETVMRLNDGYLVIVDPAAAEILETDILTAEMLAENIEIDQIAVDRRRDRTNLENYSQIFVQDNLRLYRVDPHAWDKGAFGLDLVPIRAVKMPIEYHHPKLYNARFDPAWLGLDSLISLVDQDSVEAYLYRLEAFETRLTGTDSCNAARDWIAAKFASFGYDSVVIDPFIGSQLWDRIPVQSYNVICTKPGSRYPDRQIIVGAHFDAVPYCPGADDNGTGTSGVLEIARVLKDIETEMTFIFIAFDSEESWMWGSYDYADSVAALGKNIIYMQNLDMIGHYTNSDQADLYYGPEVAYSALWRDLAGPLVGIEGHLSGYTASDHTPFMDNGYDVTFVQEFFFSSHYHQSSDSTTYIDFEYMTRMIKASLATVYTVNYVPAPVKLISVIDVGDGQSLQLSWEPGDPEQVDHYVLYYGPDPLTPADSINVANDSSRYTVDSLDEGVEYYLHIIPYDTAGNAALAYDQLSGIPYSMPIPPLSVQARPIIDGVLLTWSGVTRELDFDHFQIIRDNLLLPGFITDTVYNDWGPGLGSDLHDYWILAVDTDGNISDTTGIEPVTSRVATLRPGWVLAINRSGSNSAAMVDPAVTGEFIRESLEGLSYDYISDSSASNPDRADLLDLVNYELIVIGAESARQDDIANPPAFGGILEDIGYYLSMGGKAVIFGRWGNISANDSTVDSVYYASGASDGGYSDYFNIDYRVIPKSYLNPSEMVLESDLIGAHSQSPEYPELVWDSLAAINHFINFGNITGIPCPNFSMLQGTNYEVLYTYNSATDSALTEGKPVAWRSAGGLYEYVFFDIPLSFMKRNVAIDALRQAVGDMGIISDVDEYSDMAPLPHKFDLSQNYPNPFNPNTIIEFYNPQQRPAEVILEVFNILGQKIRMLYNEAAPPGWNRIEWDGCDHAGEDVASGIYFYRFKAGDQAETRKMLLLR